MSTGPIDGGHPAAGQPLSDLIATVRVGTTKGSPTVVIVRCSEHGGKVAVLASGASLEVTSYCHARGAPRLVDSSGLLTGTV